MSVVVVFALAVTMLASGTHAQLPNQCENQCVTEHAMHGALYQHMFDGTITEDDYNTVCHDIEEVQNCLIACHGGATAGTMAPGSTPAPEADDEGATNCLTASLILYSTACSGGYADFSELGACLEHLNAGYADAHATCEAQCASTSDNARLRFRRDDTGAGALVNGNTFCMTNCGLSQQLSTIQEQCSHWVGQFAHTVSQTYNHLYQLSPSCLKL